MMRLLKCLKTSTSPIWELLGGSLLTPLWHLPLLGYYQALRRMKPNALSRLFS